MMKGLNFLLVLAGACLLHQGCSRSELQVNRDEFRLLSVGEVVLVTSGNWSSKSSDSSSMSRSAGSEAERSAEHSSEPAEIALSGGLTLTADEGWIGDLTSADQTSGDLSDSTITAQHDDFVSKGTPIVSASSVSSFQIQLFNSAGASWSASTPLTESLTATRGGSGYRLSTVFNWMSDTDRVSLFAFTPLPSADNGLSVEANGYMVKYVVPNDVVKQPDFSSALAQTDVINTDGKQHMRNFNFDHRLAAVGVAIHGWNVRVTKVEVLGVSFGGTYNLHRGDWTLEAATGSRTMGVNQGSIPTDGYQAGDKSWTDATNANGYMMMIPQSLNPGAQLKVTYEGVSGNADKGTITANINGLTGGVWRAGGKVMYNIQLKMAPNTSTTELTMPWKAGYTTTSPVVFGTHDPADRYTFYWSDTWNTIHSGAAKVGDAGGGAGSNYGIDATAITTTRQIWFFTKADYASTTTNRTSTVTMTGRRTGSKSFVVTQTRKPSVEISPAVPTETPVVAAGKTYTVNVKSNYDWKAASTAGGVTLSTASGTTTTGQDVTITVPANNSGASRAVSATFSTTNDGEVAALIDSKIWTGTQAGIVITGSNPAAIAQPDKSTATLTFTGSISVAWSITAKPDWITASSMSGTATGSAQNITLTATENKESANRTGTLSIKMGEVTKDFTITQNVSSISISTKTAAMIAAANSAQVFTVTVGKGTPWTVTNNSGGWLTNATALGKGNGAAQGVTLTAAANNTNATREATVTVTAGGKSETCKVTQAAPAAADFATAFVNYSVSAASWASGNKTVTPAAGLQWKLTGEAGVTVSPTVTPQTAAVTNASVSVGANNTNSARTLKYYIWYGVLNSLKTEYTITQAAPAAADFTTTFTNYTSGDAGSWASGNKTITPADGLQWKLTGEAGVTVSPTVTPQTAAVTNASVSVGANNTNSARTLKYYIWYGALNSLKTEYTITQAAPVINISAATQNVAPHVTSATFNVTATANHNGVTYTPAVGSNATSVSPNTVQTISGAGSHSKAVTVNFAANTTVAARSIVATVKYGTSLTKTHTITQAAAPPTLTISPDNPGATIPKAGATYKTNITSNTNWSATATNATITATSGSGDKAGFEIKVNASPAGTAAREVKVVFTTTTNAGQTAVTHTWTGTQEASGCFATPIPGYPNTYVATVDYIEGNNTTWYVGTDHCAAWGGRLPTKDELVAIYHDKASYGRFINSWYWSSTRLSRFYYIVHLFGGQEDYDDPDFSSRGVRCVRDMK